MRNIESKTYQSVMDILGGIKKLDIEFGPVSDDFTDIEKKHGFDSGTGLDN